MTTNSIFPVIPARDVARSRDFYSGLLELTVVFDSGWYVQLQAPGNDVVQLGILEQGHHTVPVGFRTTPAGVLVSVEVDDVDRLYAGAVEAGLPVVSPLRDEVFGQRHFMTTDPDGLLVDVITVIPYAAEITESAAVTGGAR
ncbi:VOC family protein [Rhodococcus coprophilus]|uniref:Glyoxalase family protein n=1 Tax=Rhodococcus coprophilus TaxID=38310 RepID=A0A2X4UGC4_9NOCA|nr:VOC family protein [Rhodococcus coprophilus]MBM7460055.1 catechol 2,3-dioxygenase-like lactoylglutathione lyase family enzyme [Rhodococcus coprophilus]SQI38013.1 glyoxalase family protein [Rhodococcus coprophilus]